MQQAERWESKIRTRTGATLATILRRLPSIWADRRRARRIAKGLPSFEGSVELPDEKTIYSWIEGICQTPHRRPGTPEGHKGEQWVAEKFREIGLENVTLDPIPITVWTPETWSLSVNGKKVPCFYVPNTAFTNPGGLSATLAYVGTGTPADFEKAAVAGKIAVADVTFPRMPTGALMRVMRACYVLSDPDGAVSMRTSQYLNFARQNFIGGCTAETAPDHDVYWQAFKRGAAGVCLILRDQPSNSNTHYGPYDGIMKPIPGLWIGKLDGARLRESARFGAKAVMVLEGASAPGVMRNVWGVLPGQSDETILVTSHHDSPFAGAVEDGAGVAQVQAQARAWSRVPKEKRPRTIVFVVDAGHFYGSQGAHQFARDHKEIMRKARILITLEHLAGKEVREAGEGYEETGRLALTVMFTSPEPSVIATVLKALEKRPARVTAPIPADFFGPAPTSDASGYVLEAGVPVISWIGCPYYLLDQHDTLDKIERSALVPIAGTVAEMVKLQMLMP
ncbi:MAG: M28 family peptidase [Deltaproteobacteria bacterium]|nr:M28 family peptidase [Deltaproteobacteria bacterium]